MPFSSDFYFDTVFLTKRPNSFRKAIRAERNKEKSKNDGYSNILNESFMLNRSIIIIAFNMEESAF